MTASSDARRAPAAANNGNKPPTQYESAFTKRVATFPRVAYYPLHRRGCLTAVAMVIDELLIGEAAALALAQPLKNHGARYTGRTVFQGLASPPIEDVQIWRLASTPGTHAYPDVAAVVWDIRTNLPPGIRPEQVAPNHVLIPSQYHSCPYGPPAEAPDGGVLPAHAYPQVEVAVIDSGYMTDSPIDAWVAQPIEYGQWFTATPIAPNKFAPPYLWKSEPTELRDANNDSALDALVAHGNFVAGVIAQACPRASITVVDHNGAFVVKADKADTPIPTEASVARSLWQHRSHRVINVGFAFATLPNAQVVANTTDASGPPSWTFELALQGVDTEQTVVVCPAGNQGCPIRQYPAAFHLSAEHPNVIGVGSIRDGQPSVFSNYGPWVACCTEGEHVPSTFYAHWHGKTEEAEIYPPNPGSHPVKTFTSGWAKWSGTSFAAPKVAAAIANGVGSTTSPLAAWLALKAEHSSTGLKMGNVMAGLPPV